MHYVLQYLAHC